MLRQLGENGTGPELEKGAKEFRVFYVLISSDLNNCFYLYPHLGVYDQRFLFTHVRCSSLLLQAG